MDFTGFQDMLAWFFAGDFSIGFFVLDDICFFTALIQGKRSSFYCKCSLCTGNLKVDCFSASIASGTCDGDRSRACVCVIAVGKCIICVRGQFLTGRGCYGDFRLFFGTIIGEYRAGKLNIAFAEIIGSNLEGFCYRTGKAAASIDSNGSCACIGIITIISQ